MCIELMLSYSFKAKRCHLPVCSRRVIHIAPHVRTKIHGWTKEESKYAAAKLGRKKKGPHQRPYIKCDVEQRSSTFLYLWTTDYKINIRGPANSKSNKNQLWSD